MTFRFFSPRAMMHPELEHALALHGADLTCWPLDLRTRADALRNRDPKAQAMVDQAAHLEDLLRSAPAFAVEGDQTAANRIMARLAARPLPAQDRPLAAFALPGWLLAFDLRPAWPSIAALAGMAMLGFLAGSHAVGSGLLETRLVSQRVTVSDADVSSIMFEPDPLAETGL